VSDEELFVAQGALADGVYELQFRDGFATARTYAREWLRYGDHRRSASYPERLRDVTAADVQAAARKYLHPERMQMVIAGPIGEVRAAKPLEGEPALDAFGEIVRR
jgi:predicted Zn-dependent peptidase